MNRVICVALAAICLFSFAPARGEAPSVGVVDMLKVSEGYERYATARQYLEQKKAELQTVVDEEERAVLALIEELEAVRATASQEDVARRRREIEGRDRELREFVGTTNMQFRDELDTLQIRTKDEVETVVIAIARRLGLNLVLEKNMTLYAAPPLDITGQIIAELNSRFRPLPPTPMNVTGRRNTGAATTPPTAFPRATPPSEGRRGWPFQN